MPAWLERAAPSALGAYLIKTASPRKSGLFVRHLCRCFLVPFPDSRSLDALDAADRFEVGEINADELRAAVAAAEVADNEARLTPDNWTDAVASKAAAAAGIVVIAARGYYPHAMNELRRVAGWSNSRHSTARKRSAQALRVIFFEHFGDTENPVALDPSWRTEAVVGLATGIYADRAFDHLPVLADALEDAGCANADVLAHCRGPGPHARGCWVVDLVLGKA